MIVGTAGHIDHGKTSLVKAISGVDADRLKEEKERGITIDLGFAYWPQAAASVIGFVDVPGHERFVHTMLAGAHGLDRVLLVVAADDGVMPQTREHLEIVSLLGLDRGAVALTKTDVVSAERIAAVQGEIEAVLAGTTLDESPVFPVSSVTGEGLPALIGWLQAENALIGKRSERRLFRLAVDRCFVLQGAGVVVTGMVLDGSVTVGDEVIVSPQGFQARIRSIHAQGRAAQHGVAGERCALNISGPQIEKDAIRRGDAILAPEGHAPTRRIDVELRVASGASKGIAQWTPARLHHATAEVGARIVLLGEGKPQPGDDVRVQLVLDQPIAARALDRFILRDVSASRTLGGGRFLDLRAPERRRRTAQRTAMLDALAASAPADALAGVLAAGSGAADLSFFARDRGAPLADAVAWCDIAQADPWIIGRETFALSRRQRHRIGENIIATLTDFHAAHPDLLGMGRERLRMLTALQLPQSLYQGLLRALAGEGLLVLDGSWVRLASHTVEITHEEESLWQEIGPLLSGRDRFRPPRVRDIARSLGEEENQVRRVMRRLARAGEIHEVAQDHFFLRGTLAEAVRIAQDLEADTAGWFNAGRVRDKFEAEGGTVGRKVAIQILEFFDRLGVTIRRGDLRRVNVHRCDLFETDRGGEGRESSPVGRPDFKSGWGREPVLGGFELPFSSAIFRGRGWLSAHRPPPSPGL